MNREHYIAIIGDIVDSKKIADRKQVQRELKELLDRINRMYKEDIASKFAITLGDEFQGLLKNPKNIIGIIQEIELQMLGFEIRLGIGIGEVSTDIDFEHSFQIDGSAYHRARQMIKRLQKKKVSYATQKTNIMLCSKPSNLKTDELMNSVFSLCYVLKSKWSERQKQVITAFLSSDQNQYKTAEKLGIKQSSVNKSLHISEFYSYLSALQSIQNYLAEGENPDE